MKKHIPISALLLIIWSSCSKEVVKKITPAETHTSFKEMVVHPSFTWESADEVLVYITGIETPVEIQNTFIISSDDNTRTYYKGNHKMSESFDIKIKVPSQVKMLRCSFGSISKVLEIQNRQLHFDYLPELPPVE